VFFVRNKAEKFYLSNLQQLMQNQCNCRPVFAKNLIFMQKLNFIFLCGENFVYIKMSGAECQIYLNFVNTSNKEKNLDLFEESF